MKKLVRKFYSKRLSRYATWLFLRWLRGPWCIASGLAVTLSAGYWNPGWDLRAEMWFLNYTEWLCENYSSDFPDFITTETVDRCADAPETVE
jgi:hypothetical protein